MTSLHGPSFTTFGFACRRSSVVPSRLRASLKLAGGLAFTREPRSAASASIELAPRLIAMRRSEPSVLIASGNGEICPLTVGFSSSSAWPPPGFFIARSAISVISSSVATGWVMRRKSPAVSSRFRKARNESNAMSEDYQTNGVRGIVIADEGTKRRSDGGVKYGGGGPYGSPPSPDHLIELIPFMLSQIGLAADYVYPNFGFRSLKSEQNRLLGV